MPQLRELVKSTVLFHPGSIGFSQSRHSWPSFGNKSKTALVLVGGGEAKSRRLPRRGRVIYYDSISRLVLLERTSERSGTEDSR